MIFRFILFFPLSLNFLAGEPIWTLLDKDAPGVWESDGMWEVKGGPEGMEFTKNKRPMHNSMCWTKLSTPLRRGQTVEITYRMQVPYKHVDLALGKDIARKDPYSPLPKLAEIISLGSIASTDWQTRRLTITSDDQINCLAFMCWGWVADRGTWMRVKRIRVLPISSSGLQAGVNLPASLRLAQRRPGKTKGQADWFTWPVVPHRNPKAIPARSPLQDFFPFGVYLPWERSENFKYEGFEDRWEWFDRALADIRARGMNFTSVINLPLSELDRLAKLHEKHGLRMHPQVKQFDIRFNKADEIARQLKAAVTRYRGRSVIAGWAVGEEFGAAQVQKLRRHYDIVHATDPDNTLVTIQNNVEGFQIAGESADVRIMFRDIYPFFGDPANGPTTLETSLNYYEDELIKNLTLLPRGASLWVMPQAMHIYFDPGRGKKMMVYRMPSPAEIKLQAWVALGLGAKGIAYYIYSSLPPKEPGEPAQELGLRAYDGKPTPQLDAVETLARTLVPLGGIITRLERTQTAAATDQRDLRAYLFKDQNGKLHLVAYNRDVKQPLEGRIKVPFFAPRVWDLLKRGALSPVRDGQSTVISLKLRPGDGTILELSGRLPGLPADEPPDFVPTGVYLSWERPAVCAAYFRGEKITRWEHHIDWNDVGQRLDVCVANHVDTLWVANLLPKDLPRLITECEQRNLKLLACMATIEVKKQLYPAKSRKSKEAILAYYEKEVPNLVKIAGDSKTLAGWVLSDEPNLADFEVVEQVRQIYRKHDPNRFCLVVSRPDITPQVAVKTALPVLCVDLYPFFAPGNPNGPSIELSSRSWFQRNARNMMKSIKGKHAAGWIMGMCFNEIWGPRKYDERYHMIALPGAYMHWRTPTLAEMRWQVWETLRSGAKGVFIYTLAPEAPDPKTATLNPSPPKNVSEDILAKQPTDMGPNALTNPDGSTTPQFIELGKIYKSIVPHKPLIHRWKPITPWQAGFWAIDTNFQCFFDPFERKHYAVIVNQELKNSRAIDVRIDDKRLSLYDIVRKKKLNLTAGRDPSSTGMNSATIGGYAPLTAGEGTILRIDR